MLSLPLDVYRHIRGFVLPIPYNWRKRKAHEAKLIRDEYLWQLDSPGENLYWEEMMERVTFSLYGLQISGKLSLGSDRPLDPPNDQGYQDDPKEWYRHRLQWVI